MPSLLTDRLTLVPFTLELIEAAMADKAELERLLAASVGDGWPGPDFAGILPMLARERISCPETSDFTRLIVRSGDNLLIGDVGFRGAPDAEGAVEIGYGIALPYRGDGYATEAAKALIEWAFAHTNARRVTAQCLMNNPGSARVLEKVGMTQTGSAAGMLMWEIKKL